MKNIIAVILLLLILAFSWYYWTLRKNAREEAKAITNQPVINIEADKKQALDNVRQNIVGKWISVDDDKFSREFRADGSFSDWYENEPESAGTFNLSTRDGIIYMEITASGEGEDIMNLTVDRLDQQELQISYIDEGGTLIFTRAK